MSDGYDQILDALASLTPEELEALAEEGVDL